MLLNNYKKDIDTTILMVNGFINVFETSGVNVNLHKILKYKLRSLHGYKDDSKKLFLLKKYIRDILEINIGFINNEINIRNYKDFISATKEFYNNHFKRIDIEIEKRKTVKKISKKIVNKVVNKMVRLLTMFSLKYHYNNKVLMLYYKELLFRDKYLRKLVTIDVDSVVNTISRKKELVKLRVNTEPDDIYIKLTLNSLINLNVDEIINLINDIESNVVEEIKNNVKHLRNENYERVVRELKVLNDMDTYDINYYEQLQKCNMFIGMYVEGL